MLERGTPVLFFRRETVLPFYLCRSQLDLNRDPISGSVPLMADLLLTVSFQGVASGKLPPAYRVLQTLGSSNVA
jgi:hypothetical protein